MKDLLYQRAAVLVCWFVAGAWAAAIAIAGLLFLFMLSGAVFFWTDFIHAMAGLK